MIFLEINQFSVLGIIFFLAFLGKITCKKLNIPEVTAYVISGVLIGTLISFLLGKEFLIREISILNFIPSVALGLIGFTVGTELKKDILKQLGKTVMFIAIFECLFAFIFVFLGLYFIAKLELPICLLLGAVASATAPAATVAVIRQYKARGALTSTIMAVVGIDDAMALIIYAFASSFSKGILLGDSNINLLKIFELTSINILESVVIGLVFGFIYLFLNKNIRDNDTVGIILFSFLLLQLGLSEALHISEILTMMTFGAVISNLSNIIIKRSERAIEGFNFLFLTSFFIIGGANLDVSLIIKIGAVGIFYFFLRSIGKISGASIGAKLGKAEKKIKKYVGFALLPQVGVALALALAINKDLGIKIIENGIEIYKYGEKGTQIGIYIMNILLFTTLITEIVGPSLTKYVLKKAEEIN